MQLSSLLQETGSVFNSCRRGAAAEHKDVHRMGMKSRFLTGLRTYSLLSPVREAAVLTRSPSIPLQTGLCKPSSSPRTERPLLAGLVTRAVISAGRRTVCTHRGCGPRDGSSLWHCRAGALPRGSYQSHRTAGAKCSETHFLLQKWGAETAPPSGLGQVLCTAQPLLQVYFPKTELSALHEVFSRKSVPWKIQAT